MEISENDTFYIENNILIGQKTLNLEQNCINIGELILKSFVSNPNFIGQVDAETEETNTFQDMREKSVKCALWMQKLGIRPNDVIMICTNNQLEAYIPFLAALYIGAVVSPLDQYYVEENLSYFLEQVKPAMLFIDEKFYMTVFHSMIQLKFSRNIPYPTIVFLNKNEDLLNKNLLTLEKILNDYYDMISIKLFSCAKVTNMKSIAIRLFTSGTTASPELVQIPHLAFMAPSDQQAPNMLKNDIALLFESLCFINGIFITIQAILLQVKIIRIKMQFDAEVTCKIIEKFKVTWMFLETSMCYHLINNKSYYDREKYDVSSLRTVVFTGSAIRLDTVHENLKAWLPKTSLLHAYSLTETGIIAYQRQPGKIQSCGYVSANVQLKIISINSLDSSDQLLGPNEYGEICCISPYMMRVQELHDLYNSNKLHVSIWFKTGDIGWYDEDGNIYIFERLKYYLEIKQHQFLPTIFENMLYNYSGVFEVVVIYIPNHNNDKYAIAFVTKMFGAKVTEVELKQYVTTNMNNNELRNVIFLPYLPRFSNGKINRKLLYKMGRANIFFEST